MHFSMTAARLRAAHLACSTMLGLSLLGSLSGTATASTPLIEAIKRQDAATAASLVSEVDIHALESDGTSALLWAVHHEQYEVVDALLKAGADVHHENEYGSSALFESLLKGNNQILARLLDAGADASWSNHEGETLLMLAARSGNLEAASLLLDAGADINAVEHWGGQNALMWATAQGQTAMMQRLIERGAELDRHSAVRLWDRRITSEPRPKDMNKGGFTALHYAARQGCVECVDILVKAGANINATDPDRVSALSLALINLHFDTAARLIEAGAEVNTWDLFGRTPLYLAVDMHTLPVGGRSDIPPEDDHSGLDIARMLIERGANPNAQLKLRPPYRHAVFDRRSDHILSNGATPLLRAAKAADLDSMDLLLEAGAKVDLANWMGVTPLMAAAGLGRTLEPTRGRFVTEQESIRAVQRLLAAGADVNTVGVSIKGKWAELADERPFFRDIPEDGQTALHGAARLGWDEMVRLLVKQGARLQVADHNGRTPLDLAYGRYDPPFLLPPPQPLESTIALLKALCEEAEDCTLPEEER